MEEVFEEKSDPAAVAKTIREAMASGLLPEKVTAVFDQAQFVTSPLAALGLVGEE